MPVSGDTLTISAAGNDGNTVTEQVAFNLPLDAPQQGPNLCLPVPPGPPAVSLLFSGPRSTTAGSPFSMTLTARAQNGGVATGYAGTITCTSTDVQSGLPPSYTFTAGQGGDNGIQTFTNAVTPNTTGNQTVTLTDNAQPLANRYPSERGGIW